MVTHPGTTSPLSSIEAQVVQILIQMAQIRQCLAPIEVVQLVNSLINGTQVQKDLIAFKKYIVTVVVVWLAMAIGICL